MCQNAIFSKIWFFFSIIQSIFFSNIDICIKRIDYVRLVHTRASQKIIFKKIFYVKILQKNLLKILEMPDFEIWIFGLNGPF